MSAEEKFIGNRIQVLSALNIYNDNKSIETYSHVCKQMSNNEICTNNDHDHSIAQQWLDNFTTPYSYEKLKQETKLIKYKNQTLCNFIEEKDGHWIYIGKCNGDENIPKIHIKIFGMIHYIRISSAILMLQHDENTMKRVIANEITPTSFCTQKNCVKHYLYLTKPHLVQSNFEQYFSSNDRWNVTYRILQKSFREISTSCILFNTINERGYADTIRFYGKLHICARVILTMKQNKWMEDNKQACHIHSNRRNCINVEHLYSGTREQNMNDQLQHGTRKNKKRKYDETIEKQVYELKTAEQPLDKISHDLNIPEGSLHALYWNYIKRTTGQIHYNIQPTKKRKLNDISITMFTEEFKQKVQERLRKACDEFNYEDMMHLIPKSITPDKPYGHAICISNIALFPHIWSCLIQNTEEYINKPKNHIVRHTCNVDKCILHVKLGSYSDNANDCVKHNTSSRKLNNDQVEQIRTLYNQGKRICEINKELNVSVSIISRIVHGKLYKT